MTDIQNPADPHLWLEGVEDEKAIDWVKAQNKVTLDHYEAKDEFTEIHDRALEILDSKEKLLYPTVRDELVYNFWQDATNVRGLIRRMSREDFIKGERDWETVLDVDKLAEDEEENWVYKGQQVLSPEYRKSLVWLSRGGSDATVVREFDLVTKSFVEKGFALPEAKSDVSWKDDDTLYVGTDFGEGSMTDSGYPRILKVWKRGTPLEEASTIFEVEKTDLSAQAWVVRRPGEYYEFISRVIDFWNEEKYLVSDSGELQKLNVPDDAPVQAVFKGQLLLLLRSEWAREDGILEAGTLVSVDLQELVSGTEKPSIVFQAGEGGTVESVSAIKDSILLAITQDVKTQLFKLTLDDGVWSSKAVMDTVSGTTSLAAASASRNDFFLTREDFIEPTSMYYTTGETEPEKIQNLPERFSADNLVVEQFWAESKDGTKIPYYVVRSKDLKFDGTAPTLMYGYGGFEVSILPTYMSLVGPSWVERGGVYVSTNIRGGGEFGPKWHQAALRENRQRCYEDFEAIAEDLITRRITSPRHLGIHGGSNGGLLTGAMLTRCPELFGAVLIGVPLLDMRRYNKLLAGASWMAEYGDPDKPEEWEFIKQYSPYHNLFSDAPYPIPLIYTSTKDDRVHPGHARKMTAKMQEMGYDTYYYENLEGGHAGVTNNKQRAHLTALIYSYLWERLDP